MWYAVYQGETDYVAEVLSEDEFQKEYGHTHEDHRPKHRKFETRIAAENFAAIQNDFACATYAAS